MTDCLTSVVRQFALRIVVGVAASCALGTASAEGQVTPAAAPPPAEEAPSVRVGGTLFVDYTRTLAPEIVDADGNVVNPSSFNVARAYINVTGQVSRLVSFRFTPDITRETGTGSSLNGSLTFRLKYGYLQLNLDQWLWRGTYARAGMIQTPYIEFEDSVYRYRFQGPTFLDREGYLPSADFGASFRTQFPGGYGEAVAAIYNGEGSTRADPNDQKALQVRGTLRPFPGPGPVRGLRVTAFYDDDHYVQDAPRRRAATFVSYEHRYANAGWVYFDGSDQTSLAAPRLESAGHSLWFTPRWALGTVQPSAPSGQVRASLEGLFRYDRLEPNQANDSVKERWIAGVAYWPRVTTSSVSSAFMLDVEQVRYRNFAPARPTEKRVVLHMFLNF